MPKFNLSPAASRPIDYNPQGRSKRPPNGHQKDPKWTLDEHSMNPRQATNPEIIYDSMFT